MHIDEEKTGEDTNGVKFDEALLLSFPGLFVHENSLKLS